MLSMVMVTSDTMTTATRVLHQVSSSKIARAESRLARTKEETRSEYPPSVVEEILDSCMKPMQKATTCANRFRGDVNKILESTDDNNAQNSNKINELEDLLNEMTAYHKEMTLQVRL